MSDESDGHHTEVRARRRHLVMPLMTLVKASQDFLLVSGRYVETLIIQKQAVVREAEMCAVLYKKLHYGRSIARRQASRAAGTR